jgi:hypothetical protein
MRLTGSTATRGACSTHPGAWVEEFSLNRVGKEKESDSCRGTPAGTRFRSVLRVITSQRSPSVAFCAVQLYFCGLIVFGFRKGIEIRYSIRLGETVGRYDLEASRRRVPVLGEPTHRLWGIEFAASNSRSLVLVYRSSPLSHPLGNSYTFPF